MALAEEQQGLHKIPQEELFFGVCIKSDKLFFNKKELQFMVLPYCSSKGGLGGAMPNSLLIYFSSMKALSSRDETKRKENLGLG